MGRSVPEPRGQRQQLPAGQQQGAGAWGSGAQPKKKSLEEIQREEAQRAQAMGRSSGGGGGLTMAERLAGKHGTQGGSAPNIQFQNVGGRDNSGGTPEEMTTHLKTLLGVQSPGRPRERNTPSAWSGAARNETSQSGGINADRTNPPPQSSRQGSNAGWTDGSRSSGVGMPANAAAAGQVFWGGAQDQKKDSSGSDGLSAGAQLDPGMKAWSLEQMRKIKGNSDLTLVSFCMTLSSNSEIREYMRDVLGSTPQVSSFASEFIRRKNKLDESKRRRGGK